MKVNRKEKSIVDKNISNQNLITKKFLKKNLIIFLISMIFVILLVGIIIFFINKIPSKYYGTYVRNYYFNGEESKAIIKISPLSIKISRENFDEENETESLKYSKKGNDIIIERDGEEDYIIIDEDCLYIESSKDISLSKKYGSFYWNVKSNKADIYEIENKSDNFESLLETVVNSWARETIYNASDKKVDNTRFYAIKSDEETDKTDLNTYEIKFKGAGGDLTLYYDRKSKTMKRLYFSGSVLNTLYGGTYKDSMDLDDLYDCRAMLLASMYILANKDKVELNQNIRNLNTMDDLVHRTIVSFDFDELFKNKTTYKNDENNISYSLKDEKYDISYTSSLSSSTYSLSGFISWDISVKN